MIYSILSLGVITTLSIAWILVYKKNHTIVSKWLLFPLTGGIVWAFGCLGIHIILSRSDFFSKSLYVIFQQIMFTGLIAVPLGLIIAALYYPYNKIHMVYKNRISYIISILYILCLIPIYTTFYLFQDINISTNGVVSEYGPLFQYYHMGLGGALFISIIVIISRLKHIQKKKDKIVLLYFIMGYFITIIGYIASTLFIFIQGDSTFMKYSPLLLLAWIGFIVIGAIKYKLVDSKIFLSQIIIIWAIIIITVITLSNTSPVVFIVDILFLIVFSILGIILIQTLQESLYTKKYLNRDNRKLQKFIDVKDNFLRMTTHQLRTPVIILEEYTSNLINKISKKKLYELDYLHKILINNYRLKEVMGDLTLTYAIEAKKFELNHIVPVDISLIIEHIIKDIETSQKYLDIMIRLDKANRNYIINGDTYYLELAFKKVIQNACIFANKQIIICLRTNKDQILISIIDDGIGINKDDFRQLFLPFVRGAKALVLNPDGSGLGLYLVKNIINNHEGKFTLKSEGENLGAEAIIILPKNTL
jgi:signal transduction histidine kinase